MAVRWIVPPLAVELAPGHLQSPVVPGSLGGVRALAADILWLQAHLRWEARDVAGTKAGLRRAVAANPGSLGFWLNGARVLAYDIPEWRKARRDVGSPGHAKPGEIELDQAGQALAWLDEAKAFHGDAPEIFVERALIELYRLHDLAAAADSFHRAAERPGAPDYAARLYTALWRRLKRSAGDREWCAGLPGLAPALGDAPGTDWVEARVRNLEGELGKDFGG